jgi:hypothetical protein
MQKKATRVQLTVIHPPGIRKTPTALGLQFPYSLDLVEVLKAALAEARVRTGRGNVGGWLPNHKPRKCWFVEFFAWPVVRQRLAEAGCHFEGEAEALAQQPAAPAL